MKKLITTIVAAGITFMLAAAPAIAASTDGQGAKADNPAKAGKVETKADDTKSKDKAVKDTKKKTSKKKHAHKKVKKEKKGTTGADTTASPMTTAPKVK